MNTNQCTLDINTIAELVEILDSAYRVSSSEFIVLDLMEKNRNSFEVLIGIILSQNTSDKNAMRAFNNLKQIMKGTITPDELLKLDLDTIARAIRVAGMVNRRIKTIVSIAKFIDEDKGFFNKLKQKDGEEIRRILLGFDGVGPKTADVFILMHCNKPSFPIDTHIRRVLIRLGYFSASNGYEFIRRSVMYAVNNDVDKLKRLHVLLIHHGRVVCKARKPICSQCILRHMCCRIGVS